MIALYCGERNSNDFSGQLQRLPVSLAPGHVYPTLNHSLHSPCTPLKDASRRDAPRTTKVLVMAITT